MDLFGFIGGIFNSFTPFLLFVAFFGGVAMGRTYLYEEKVPNDFFYHGTITVFGFYLVLFLHRFVESTITSLGTWIGVFLVFGLYMIGCFLGRNSPK